MIVKKTAISTVCVRNINWTIEKDKTSIESEHVFLYQIANNLQKI